MRIISGKYKRKQLKGFNIVGTRPTMDRVKESMFAMIQNQITNSICLDLFAGSGALGIEAISMGAKECYFVDNNKEAIKVINDNLKGIKEKTFVLNKDYKTALKYFKTKQITFDLIILDPPYQTQDILSIIKQIDKYNLLKEDGLIIVETTLELIDYYPCVKTKKIGDKLIKIYKK